MWVCRSLAELRAMRRQNTKANTADVQIKPAASPTWARAILSSAMALGRIFDRPWRALIATQIPGTLGNKGSSEAPREANGHAIQGFKSGRTSYCDRDRAN